MFIEIGVVILGILAFGILVGQYWIWKQIADEAKIAAVIARQNASSIESGVAEIKASLEKEERDKLIKTLEVNLDLLRQSSILASKQKEYKQFFSVILETIQEDTKWLRSSLFQRFGEVPEFMDINSQVIAFENKIEQIRVTLKEYKMLDNYDE